MIPRGAAEALSKLLHEELTENVIGAAIEVHRALGPGRLESAYEECRCREFNLRGLAFECQVPCRSNTRASIWTAAIGWISLFKMKSFSN
jgi:hypothetical protein